jgi:hypothetical protein
MKYKEIVAAFTGHRGGGKTANAVGWLLDAMAGGLLGLANIPIKPVTMKDSSNPEDPGKHIEAKVLNMREFLVLSESFKKSVMLIDELPLYASSLRVSSNNNFLLQQVSQQLRKLQMTVLYTLQAFKFGDPYFSFQTDLVFECKDLSFTPWGREEGLEEGELIGVQIKDLTGVYTGRPFAAYPETHCFTVNIKPIWGIFDTYLIVDPKEGRVQYQIEKEQVLIGHNAEGSYIKTVQSPEEKEARFQSIVNQLVANNADSVSSNELFGYAAEVGIDADNIRLGVLARKFGLLRKQDSHGYYYLLPNHPNYEEYRAAIEQRLLGRRVKA